MQYKKNHFGCRNISKTNLQLFAEGDGGGLQRRDAIGAEAGSKSAEGDRSRMFDNFLQQKGNQAEFDRRVQKATQTAVNNAKKKWDALPEKEKTEDHADRQQRGGRICITFEY